MTYNKPKNPISQGAQSCYKEITEKLINAASEQGIAVDPNTISIGIIQNGSVVVNSAVEGLTKIDAIDYEQGVLTNFIYTDVGGPNLAPGFYAVTTFANWVKLGPIDIRLHYSQDGNLVSAVPGTAIVTSLQVPSNVDPLVRTGLHIGAALPPLLTDWEEYDWEADPPTIRYYTKCSNGLYSCSDPEPLPVDG